MLTSGSEYVRLQGAEPKFYWGGQMATSARTGAERT